VIILLFFYINLLTESVYGAIININRIGRNSRTKQPYELPDKTRSKPSDEPVSPKKMEGGRSMEKFLSLPAEKQNKIIDAALNAFSTNGYKKTSVSDVAAAAGISKAMVFHYFGTKKDLYLYLVNLCGETIVKAITEGFDYSVTDFFDRIKLTTRIEISVMKKHHSIPSFLASMYFENDGEVREDIQAILAKGEGDRNRIAFEGVDFSKFKDEKNIELLMKMLTWIGDGYANQMKNKPKIDYDEMYKEFEECLELLRKCLYKEEYL
jgi:TetR/AcrR family transcriptional regulator